MIKYKQLNNYSTVKEKNVKINTENLPICECDEVHSEALERKKEKMPHSSEIYDLSDFFKVLGDSTRMNILFAINGEPMCVCDIADLLSMTKSAVSHQLKILRRADLVTYKKNGKNVFYELADSHVVDIIEKAFEHIKE